MTRDDLRELANDLRRQESGHVEIETIDQPIDVPIEVETAEAIGAADELVFDAEELAELRRRVAAEARAEEVAEAAELKQRQELDRHLNNDEGSSGYQRLMYKAWGIRKLKPGPKLTLFAILRYCWSDDHCTVSEEFLAADAGAGVRSIQRYVNELEKRRYIGVYRRSNGRNTYTNRDRELIPRRMNKKKQHLTNWRLPAGVAFLHQYL